MSKVHRSQFLQSLKELFPDLIPEINQQQGSIYFEMAVFRRYCTQCIFHDDREAIEKCYNLAEKVYLNGNKSLRNAIDVEFVEGLEFVKDTQKSIQPNVWAWERFPDSLKDLYIAFHV
jgi:hypothetical protein